MVKKNCSPKNNKETNFRKTQDDTFKSEFNLNCSSEKIFLFSFAFRCHLSGSWDSQYFLTLDLVLISDLKIKINFIWQLNMLRFIHNCCCRVVVVRKIHNCCCWCCCCWLDWSSEVCREHSLVTVRDLESHQPAFLLQKR